MSDRPGSYHNAVLRPSRNEHSAIVNMPDSLSQAASSAAGQAAHHRPRPGTVLFDREHTIVFA